MASLQGRICSAILHNVNIFGSGVTLSAKELAKLRKRMDTLAVFSNLYHVDVNPVRANGVPAEYILPKRPKKPCTDKVILYIHGGAWSMGSRRSNRSFAANVAVTSGCRILSVDYRLAPEFPFPAGLRDCASAYLWLMRHEGIAAENIILMGDSSGGNMALALPVLLQSTNDKLPSAVIAISPPTDFTQSGESHRSKAKVDPLFGKLSTQMKDSIADNYIQSHAPDDPMVSPLFADLSGFPRLLLMVGENEVLFDDCIQFGARAREKGVEATVIVWPGMFHLFHLFSPFIPEAQRAVEDIAEFISASDKGKAHVSLPLGYEVI
ncbi:Alpha/beta hydrolase [gamma proteobacterium HdN1]|nr:Alpha/beta hydrolase [gamma proteobacterium HdN1]